MKAIVAGGTGFVGGRLTARLLEKGWAVAVLTRGGKPAAPGCAKAELLKADISLEGGLDVLVPRNADVLVHCAAMQSYFGDKRLLFQANVQGTLRLLKFAAASGIRRFIYISSIEAMGACSSEEVPADETRAPSPLSTYGESKLEAERVVTEFAAANGMEACVLRLGNVYGHPSPAFIQPVAEAISNGGSLLRFLPAYGERLIHPLFIDDAVSGIMRCMDKPAAGCYIIAGKEYVSVAGLFHSVAGQLGVRLQETASGRLWIDRSLLWLRDKKCRFMERADLLAYFTAGSGGNVHRAYSIAKAERELDWHPGTGLGEGVKLTLAAMRGSK